MSDQAIPGRSFEHHTYRVEVRVPRVARDGMTWRCLVEPVSHGAALDHAGHLRDSLLAAGFFEERLVDKWFSENVRLVEYKSVLTRERELPMSGKA